MRAAVFPPQSRQKRERGDRMFKIVRENDDWEKLIDDDGKVIAEAHHLDVEDVLYGLKIPYECEDINTDEGQPRLFITTFGRPED